MKSFKEKISNLWALALILLIWGIITETGIAPRFMLPSPVDVVKAFIGDFPLLLSHARVTLSEALLGLLIGIAVGFLGAVAMDKSEMLCKAFYPVIILTQTVPTVALAPLLVLWLGYDMLPKVALVALTTFFPICVNLLDGFKRMDRDAYNMLLCMKASETQIFRYLKLPTAMPHFFSGLKTSVSYSVVTAVISEWLGGFYGLGVYMTRVKKSYKFDKMFAVIILISVISLLMIYGVKLLQKFLMPYEYEKNEEKE